MNTKGFTPRERRKLRVRKKITGTSERPRLTVYRSNKHVYVQIVDDLTQKTIVSASTLVSGGKSNKGSAEKIGREVAEKATQGNITQVVFDRNGYQYHGVIKQIAESAREAGLKF